MKEEAREAYLQRRRQEIGQRVKAIRRYTELSQEEVAAYLGCSRIKVNRAENGATEFSTGELELLAELFEVTILHFLGIELTVSFHGSQQQFTLPM